MKYCSFFLDDLEMRAKFEAAASNTVNLFGVDETSNVLSVNSSGITKAPCELKFCQEKFKQNFVNQTFSLPPPLIRYTLENAKADILLKLHHSCKRLFQRHLKLVCHQLVLRKQMQPRQCFKYIRDSLELTVSTVDFKLFKNYYISNNLQIYNTSANHRNTLSNLLNVFYRCEVKFLTIFGQDLTMREFTIVVEHGNIKVLNFYDVRITKDDGDLIYLEEILALLPKLYSIKLVIF